MANIYGPILPLQLDSRNTAALVRAIQTRINLESDGKLNDFTSASPLSSITEGQAIAQSELLFYLNNLPEAFSLQWLRQLGVQRRIGSRALVEVSFYNIPGYDKVITIPKGTRVYSTNRLSYILLEEVRIFPEDFSSKGICRSEKWGEIYNVGAGSINKIEKNILGLEYLTNLTEASGGKDLETIDSMKVRAFEVLSRRNLTTPGDFQNEVSSLAPEAAIVKILTHEERFNLSPNFSGNVVVCLGTENGSALTDSALTYLIKTIKNRVTIGTNVSFIPPDVIPVELVVELYYDPSSLTSSLDLLAQDVLNSMREYISPQYLGLGNDLNYNEVIKSLYDFDFIKSINNASVKLMLKGDSLDGPCAGFSGEGVEATGKCLYDYIDIIDSTNTTYSPPNGITSYKLYNAQIAFTSVIDYRPITYTYEELYTV